MHRLEDQVACAEKVSSWGTARAPKFRQCAKRSQWRLKMAFDRLKLVPPDASSLADVMVRHLSRRQVDVAYRGAMSSGEQVCEQGF